eukprot:264077_1
MSARLWLGSYKPSLNTGAYGVYTYPKPIRFYPKELGDYLALEWDPKNRNNVNYVQNKFKKLLKHIDFNVDVWYPFIEKFTFDTKFVDIPPKYAHSIIKFYRYRYYTAASLSLDDIANLVELHQLLQKEITGCIQQWFNDDHIKEDDKGVFIRFSNRSPKDGHKIHKKYDDQKEESLTAQQMKQIEEDPNSAFIAYWKRIAKDLMVNNANDAMELILSSERVFKDLLLALSAHKWPYKYLSYNQFTIDTLYENDNKELQLQWNEEQWDICRVSIAIRKWDNRIRDDLEFRCFVYDKQIRGISQYNHYCYFRELGDNAAFVTAIKKKICQFFEQIIGLVPLFHYVIDLGIIVMDESHKENIENLRVVIIELNPFEDTTGSGLFSWRNDKKQLKYAKQVEIRVHHRNIVRKELVLRQINQDVKYGVEKPWHMILNEINHELNEKIQKKKGCIMM